MLLTAATLAALTTTREDALVGRWGTVKGQPRVLLDLQPNGLAQLFVSAGIWTANEHELRLVTPDKPDTTHAFPYSFDGKKLKVVLDRDPMTLERLEAPPEYRSPKSREQLLDHMLHSQLSVYERVSEDVDSITEQNCNKLPKPSPLTWDDLPPVVP
jgi:hypothetical protein